MLVKQRRFKRGWIVSLTVNGFIATGIGPDQTAARADAEKLAGRIEGITSA